MSSVEKKEKKVKIDESFLQKVLKTVDEFTGKVKELFKWKDDVTAWQKLINDRMNQIQDNRAKSVHVPIVAIPRMGDVKEVKINRKDHNINFEIIFKDNRTADEVVMVGKKIQEEIEDMVIKYRVKKLDVKIDI